MKRPRRTLAVDVTAKGFGYVLLEGRESLADWGMAQVMPGNPARLRARVKKLLRRLEPELLVLEEPSGSRRGKRARKIIRELARLADEEGVAWCYVPGEQVRDAFGNPSNKHEIAVAVTRLFPELEPRLPAKRTIWDSERERMGIFDAASFALTVLGGLDKAA